MILADTTVWIDHLRSSDAHLAALLEAGSVAIDPFVIGEIALGSLRQRSIIIEALTALPRAPTATHDEIMPFIDQARLWGIGIGLVDAHLLASTRLLPGCRLWTRDKRLAGAAERLRLGYRAGDEN